MKSESPPIQVLIADDEENIRFLLRKVLQAENIKVFLAADGKEAVQIINSTPIDIVITDLKMPKLDGFGLLEQSKQSHQRIPEVVLMTGFIDQARGLAIKMGAKGVIQKPFSGREFLSWLHMSIGDKFKPYFEGRLRFPVKIPVEYGPPGKSKKFEGAVLNVSRGGMLVGTSQWIPESNSSIQCSLRLSQTSVISLTAIVRWAKDLNSPEFPKGFGVDLRQTSSDSLQKLEQFVRTLLP